MAKIENYLNLSNFFSVNFLQFMSFPYLCNMNFTHTILHWFAENGRNLPWRETTDPYAIWLSEVILQQTRVAQGQAYWERFIARWPHVSALAHASEDEVLREWQGLGYYSRARNLHTAAKQIVERGSFPKTFNEIKMLKGVGDYTAAAIASISFNEPIAVVDGNVYRVLSRYFGIGTPIDSTTGKKEFKTMAQELIDKRQPATFNQAIMDFGAIQCTPSAPRCDSCPLLETCVAFRTHKTELLPVKSKKIKLRERHFTYIYTKNGDEIAIRRRGKRDIWQGLWEFPTTKDITLPTEAKLLKSKVKHVLTHQIIFADFYLWNTEIRPENLPGDFIWIKENQLDGYALPKLIENLLKSLSQYDITSRSTILCLSFQTQGLSSTKTQPRMGIRMTP